MKKNISKKESGTLSCGKCGETLNIEKYKQHKCKVWKQLIYQDYKVTSLITFGIYASLMTRSNWILLSLPIFAIMGYSLDKFIIKVCRKKQYKNKKQGTIFL